MQPAAPNSPEALKAARKLLNGFLFLAALNLLVIAFAFWPGSRKETPSSADLPAMREVLEAALDDWQRGDARGFYTHFASANIPADRPATFAERYTHGFGEKFGRLGARTPVPGDAPPGTLVVRVECERNTPARITARFVREDGRIKLTELTLAGPDSP